MWTLWGMGITAAGTLILLLLAYIAQSPRLISRLGMSGLRLDLRARSLTGYALALLLLAFGFFLAGVPLGSQSAEKLADAGQVESGAEPPTVENDTEGAVTTVEPEGQENNPAGDSGTSRPASGAFAGLPPSAQTATAEILETASALEEAVIEDSDGTGTVEATSTPTDTPTQTPLPSPTSSHTPTTTPTPTLTPTPIFEDTATINTGGSTTWIKRTPGGRDFYLVRGGDIVILYPGHANIGGDFWREVSTTNGVVGWILESYLTFTLTPASGDGG